MTENSNSQEIAESKYPETTKEFKKIMETQYQIFCKKMLDYGVSNISNGTDLSTEEDINFSLTGLFFRKNDKIQRLKQLVVLRNRNQVNESIIDTYQDLTNYSIISQIVKNKKWGK